MAKGGFYGTNTFSTGGVKMKHDEEKETTANEEIEIARLKLAKQINDHLENPKGVKDLVALATAVERIR